MALVVNNHSFAPRDGACQLVFKSDRLPAQESGFLEESWGCETFGPRNWDENAKSALRMDHMDRIVSSIRSMRSTEVGGKSEKGCVDGPHGTNHGNSIHAHGRNRIKVVCGWTAWNELLRARLHRTWSRQTGVRGCEEMCTGTNIIGKKLLE